MKLSSSQTLVIAVLRSMRDIGEMRVSFSKRNLPTLITLERLGYITKVREVISHEKYPSMFECELSENKSVLT